MKAYGDKRAVFLGKARKTRGNLTKKDLMVNKNGRIVSKKRSRWAKFNSNLGRAVLK